jgi:hypothetical protein
MKGSTHFKIMIALGSLVVVNTMISCKYLQKLSAFREFQGASKDQGIEPL